MAGGAICVGDASTSSSGGSGGSGTSYRGGSGGGAVWGHDDKHGTVITGNSGYGITGGLYKDLNNAPKKGASSGAGSPGGLIIIYGKEIINKGNISSTGTSSGGASGANAAIGGGSGGGSINIFYKTIFYKGNISSSGGGTGSGTSTYNAGGKGGNGCITIGSMQTGVYVDTTNN